MTIEEPKFSLALKEGAFEIRDYAAAIAAEVTVKGTQAEASRKGFRLLWGALAMLATALVGLVFGTTV